MEQYIWLAAIFIGASLAYWAGTAFGRADADKAPSENAWENVRKYSIDANIEIAKCQIQADHEEEMAVIERGAFDHIEIGGGECEDDSD